MIVLDKKAGPEMAEVKRWAEGGIPPWVVPVGMMVEVVERMVGADMDWIGVGTQVVHEGREADHMGQAALASQQGGSQGLLDMEREWLAVGKRMVVDYMSHLREAGRIVVDRQDMEVM